MQPSKPMMDGWQMMSVILGENTGAQYGAAYIAAIENEINSYSNVINNVDSTTDYYKLYKNTQVAQQKGNVAEDFQVGTFNVDAAAKQSWYRGIKLGVNLDGSVDTCIVDIRKLTRDEFLNPAKNYDSIVEKGVEKYQMKVYGNPKQGFDALADARYFNDNQQALTTEDTKNYIENDPKGIKHVLRQTNSPRQNVAETNKHAADTLTDHMEHNGVKSKSATNARYEEMAKASRIEKEYNPYDDGVSVSNSVTADLLVKEALKAGATAATITFMLQLAPEIVKVIDYLIKNGELNWKQIQQFGKATISSSARSFISGSVAAGLIIAAKKGLLGAAAQTINSTVLGALVTIVLDTVINSIKLAAGKITAKQMGGAFVDVTVLSATFIGSGKIGGVIGQAIAPQLPIIGYALGTLIGCSVGVLYNIGKKKLISFCKDSGFTCFGLVDQDYSVPEELLNEMGIETAKIERAEIERNSVNVLSCASQIGRTEVDTVSYKMVKRGVFGVNKVGYVI